MRSFHNSDRQKLKTLIIRAIALGIAALMVLGVLVSAVISVNAAAETSEKYKIYSDDDFMVRIGILYSDDVEDSHGIFTSHDRLGFRLYATKDKEMSYIWTLSEPQVSFCSDGNLKQSVSKGMVSYTRSESATIGGFHIKLDGTYPTEDDAETALNTFEEKSPDTLIFPCYENGVYVIKCGSYTTSESASADIEKYTELFGVPCTAVGYTDTSVKVLEYETGRVLFSFDNGTEYGLGAYPVKQDGEENYLQVDYSDYYRAGVFEFKPYKDSKYDGLSLIMISEIEEYIQGVIPWEIVPSWDIEIVKAFAITARSYTYRSIDKHKTHGFDLCSTANCQVHRGHSLVNNNVIRACTETKGLVLACGDELVSAYYHALSGGSIAAGHQVWNQAELPYLQGMYTPWEILDRANGSWQYTVSAEDLCDQLNDEGYTKLKDAIADIKITLCDNSTYVYNVVITDIHGNTQSITRTRHVKNAFSPYLNSGNFVISHNGVIEDGKEETSISGIYVMTADGIKVIRDEEKLNIQTALGVLTATKPETLSVKTSASMVTCDVLAETKAFLENAVPQSQSTSDFTFIGSGNGHGVGLSQWGGRDLAALGKKCNEILTTYFPTTVVVPYDEFIKG